MDYYNYYKKFKNLTPKKLIIEYNLRFIFEHFLGFEIFQNLIKSWDKKIQKKIYNSVKLSKKTNIKIKEFDSNINPKILREDYIKKGIPFVIRSGAKKWNAFLKWDFIFFKKKYGNHPVTLSNHPDLGDYNNQNEGIVKSNLKEIIEGIDKNSMKYARFNPLLDTYKELQNDLNQDWLNKVRNTKIKKHHVLFIGNKGTKTNIHTAGTDNIFVQIRGKKKWLIWDQKTHYIINPKVNRAPAKVSNINPNKINDSNLAFNHLPICKIILNEGDIIFIPAYLWHYVENLTPSIGIGIRWLSIYNSFRNNPLLANLELFNTSPYIFSTLNWRKGFDFNKILTKNVKKNQ
tara:strand:- start:3103 stop:4140 length:1038 start_codon:yes stop_codon:yes gene_type:complete